VLIIHIIAKNLGETDRIIRLAGGIILLGLPLIVTLPIIWQVIVWVASVEMLLTAATGY
jgi:hypothetical protein